MRGFRNGKGGLIGGPPYTKGKCCELNDAFSGNALAENIYASEYHFELFFTFFSFCALLRNNLLSYVSIYVHIMIQQHASIIFFGLITV